MDKELTAVKFSSEVNIWLYISMTNETKMSFRTAVINRRFIEELVRRGYYKNMSHFLNSMIEKSKKEYPHVWEFVKSSQL